MVHIGGIASTAVEEYYYRRIIGAQMNAPKVILTLLVL